jgi:ribosome biogenesis GTPase
MEGLVVKNTGSRYQIKTADGRFLECKIKGNFRLKGIRSTNPIAVGDRVSVDESNDDTALITAIADRKNYIIRRSSNLSHQSHIIAANLDQVFLIVTVNYPVTTTTFIDRFLVSSEAYRIPVRLIFNKIDRYEKPDLELLDALTNLYEIIGYPCHAISAQQDKDFTLLENLLKDKVTLLSGHSGAGKTTVINRILPEANLKTGDLSEYHNKGMHTTTFSEMLELPFGGYLIDTPGIKGFGLIDMADAEVSHYFPEMFAISGQCRFNNCTHRHEPGCAVLEAVKNHYISRSRYNSYLSILQDKDEGKYREAF